MDFGLANDSQKGAIMTTEGPVLIVAGPGTGKTFTLVKRLSYLFLEKKIKPEEVMVVTFTEKAGKELITRISSEFVKCEINFNINDMYIGTFHAVCLRLLKEYATYLNEDNSCRVLDAFEQVYLVCRNIENFKVLGNYGNYISKKQGDWQQALEICRYVNQLMEEMVDIDAMLQDRDEDMRFLAKLVVRYRELLKRHQVMDFSMIQTRTYEMLEHYPEITAKIVDTIKYIMVDEYQDTNYIQEQLIFKLAGERKNICVVGDDDQGMYRFRGATIRNILEFPEKFCDRECKVVHLNKNYRSEPGIIKFYSEWMDNEEGRTVFNWNKFRYPKELVAEKNRLLTGDSVYSCGGTSLEEEKRELLRMIQNLKKNGNITDYNQVAVLLRSVKSEEAKALGAYLEKHDIPVYSPRSDLFFERIEVKQLLGCLIMCFPSYVQDLKQNEFRYRIHKNLRKYYIECIKLVGSLCETDALLYNYIKSTMHYIREIKEPTDYGLLDIFYRLISYKPFKEYLEADLQENVLATRAARNLSELSRMIARYEFLHDMHGISLENKLAMPEEFFNVYLKYLYIDGIGEYEDESEYAPSGCVSFMTIHQSKGLEFPVVVVGSLGNVPRNNSDTLLYSAESRFFHRQSFEPVSDIKYFDFWRLYYTAFSRAENLLVLAYKNEDSKYFKDYLARLPKIVDFQERTRFQAVKEIHYKQIYSFTSHISVYDGCPMQYKYYKELGFVPNKMFHTSVGSLVHATLEDMNRCIIAGDMALVNEDAITQWFELNYKSMQEQTGYFLNDEQKENALQQVIRYYHHRKNELGKVWKAEDEVNLILPNYILQGIIDLVEGQGDTVEIVDYKTGPKPDVQTHPGKVAHYKKQLEIYAYLIEQKYKKKVSKMHLYYTSTEEGSPLISFEWKQCDIDRTVAEISETIRNIEDKKFDKKVQNVYACNYCDMKHVCGTGDVSL